MADGITLTGETHTDELDDLTDPGTTWPLKAYRKYNLIKKVMESGKIAGGIKFPHEVSDFSRKRISSLPTDFTRIDNPLKYRVGISGRLLNLRNELAESFT
jgi:nicotinate phosphoribosyltransferase